MDEPARWPEPLPDPRRLLRRLGLRPNKLLGQNFLVNQDLARRIARAAAALKPGLLVEVGGGLGHLTEKLLQESPASLLVVERDQALAGHLELWFAPAGRVEVLCQDARSLDWAALAPAGGQLVAVGNLPFSVGTEILVAALSEPKVAGGVFMVQREVAERILSPPGRKSYGALSVVCQLAAELEGLFRVRSGSFHPPPEVEAMVLRWEGKPDREPGFLERVGRLARALFAARRKTLPNALRAAGLPRQALGALGARARDSRRPEALTPQEFAEFTVLLEPWLSGRGRRQ